MKPSPARSLRADDTARRTLLGATFWLCLPAFVLAAADGLITLWGQPEAYWSSGYATVCEGNPLAAWVMSLHPLAFAAAGVPYLLLVFGAVATLPRRGAAAVAIAIPLAHAVGVASWCVILFPEPWLPLGVLGLGLVGLAAVAWRKGWCVQVGAGSVSDGPSPNRR